MRFPVYLLLLIFLAACADEDEKLPVVQRDISFRADGVLDFLRPDGTVITRIAIEIADTDSARARGLMERRSLPERGGMLFIMDEDTTQQFWMENTPLPLDLVFVGSDSLVVNIAERTHPYSRELITSTGPARYVVEVRAGFADRHGLTDSTRIRWRRIP